MKLIILFITLLLTTTNGAFCQQTRSDVKLINRDGKYIIEFNGKQFKANENILTVKFKDSIQIKSNLKILRQNKLGFVDVKVPEKKNIEEFAKELQETGLFEIIEFNAYGNYNTFVPNDSLVTDQWYLSNINMYNVWDILKGGPCIVIGILDSGTDWEHEDIGIGPDSYQNIFLNPGEDIWSNVNDPTTGNGIDDDGNGLIDDWKGWNYGNNTNDSRPVFYHGTFVSGIAAAKTNNSLGIAGITGGNHNQGVKILPYCVGLNAPDGAVIDDAIVDAVDMGVKVINLSLDVASSTAINTAIQYAINHDVVIVASTGNDNSSSVSYPASNSNVIAVGATTTNNTRASFSNYGTGLDIVAPGVDITSITPNDNYDTESGTSFAAPQVSAIAALLFSIDNTLTALEVKNILESTAQKVGGYTYNTTSGHANGTWNNEMGYGLLNPYVAILEVFDQMNLSFSGPPNSVICSTGYNFTLNNPPESVNTITWNTGPNLTVSSGQNSSNPTIKATGSGFSWVSVSLGTDCGSITSPQRRFWVGPPSPNYLDIINSNYGQDILVAGVSNVLFVQANSNMTNYIEIDDYDWDYSPYLDHFEAEFIDEVSVIYLPPLSNGYQTIYVRAHSTSCPEEGAWHSETFQIIQGYYYLSFSPNPSLDETTLSIERKLTKEEALTISSEPLPIDENAEWDLEVYDNIQRLKLKNTKTKGKHKKINTSGWNEGVYVVRVIYKDEVLTGKLIVTK